MFLLVCLIKFFFHQTLITIFLFLGTIQFNLQKSFPSINSLDDLHTIYKNRFVTYDSFQFSINKDEKEGSSNETMEYELSLNVKIPVIQDDTKIICNDDIPAIIESEPDDDNSNEENVQINLNEHLDDCVEENVEIINSERKYDETNNILSDSNLEFNAVNEYVGSDRSHVSQCSIKLPAVIKSVNRTYSYKLTLKSIKFNHKIESGIWQIR